jgi:hypothetical protein
MRQVKRQRSVDAAPHSNREPSELLTSDYTTLVLIVTRWPTPLEFPSAAFRDSLSHCKRVQAITFACVDSNSVVARC